MQRAGGKLRAGRRHHSAHEGKQMPAPRLPWRWGPATPCSPPRLAGRYKTWPHGSARDRRAGRPSPRGAGVASWLAAAASWPRPSPFPWPPPAPAAASPAFLPSLRIDASFNISAATCAWRLGAIEAPPRRSPVSMYKRAPSQLGEEGFSPVASSINWRRRATTLTDARLPSWSLPRDTAWCRAIDNTPSSYMLLAPYETPDSRVHR